MKNILAFSFGMVLLSACAFSPRAYVPPTAGPIADIEFVSDPRFPSSIFTFENANDCSKRSLLKPSYAGDVHVKARAEGEFVFMIGYDISGNLYEGTGCVGIYSLIPKEGGRYRITSDVVENGKRCSLSAVSLDESESKAAKIVITKRELGGTGFDENSSFCTARR